VSERGRGKDFTIKATKRQQYQGVHWLKRRKLFKIKQESQHEPKRLNQLKTGSYKRNAKLGYFMIFQIEKEI
jgi:hypothetical protein